MIFSSSVTANRFLSFPKRSSPAEGCVSDSYFYTMLLTGRLTGDETLKAMYLCTSSHIWLIPDSIKQMNAISFFTRVP